MRASIERAWWSRLAPATDATAEWAPIGTGWGTSARGVVPARRASSNGEFWRTYLSWSGWVAVAFFAVYPTMNWITSLRPGRLHLYLRAELDAPFVPQLIWAYLSMYVLFLVPPLVLPAARMPALGRQLIVGTIVSGLLFLVLPAELGFARAVPTGAPYAGVYAAVFNLDRPYNLVPSLHVVYSTAIALACADVSRPVVRMALYAWLIVIAASTVLVHQHHVLDLASSFVLVFLLRRRTKVTHV